jgi:DNA-binding winged helix-turn-helix (wHTH) protein
VKDYGFQHKGKNYILSLQDSRLYREGIRVRLSEKPYALAVYLITHPNKVLTGDEIRDHVWGKTSHATAQDLNVLLNKLRTKLDDSEKQLIEAIDRRGFCFNLKTSSTPEIEELNPTDAPQTPQDVIPPENGLRDPLTSVSDSTPEIEEPNPTGALHMPKDIVPVENGLRDALTSRSEQFLPISQVFKKKAWVLILGVLSAILFFSYSDATPYGSLTTTVSASQIEEKANGIAGVFAPEIEIDECSSSYGSETDWAFSELIRLRGWPQAVKFSQYKTDWGATCRGGLLSDDVLYVGFDRDGKLESVKFPHRQHVQLEDYETHVGPATQVAEQLFQVNLQGMRPRPFRFDGHGYLFLNDGSYYIDYGNEGVPFRWDFANSFIIVQLSNDNRLLAAEHFSWDKDDPKINRFLPAPTWKIQCRTLANLILAGIALLAIWKRRRTIIKPKLKKTVLTIAAVFTLAIFPDIRGTKPIEFSSYFFGRYIDDMLASIAVSLIVFIAMFAVLFVLTSLVFDLRRRSQDINSTDIKAIANVLDNHDISIQVIVGVSIGLLYLAIHIGFLEIFTIYRMGSWTALWALNGHNAFFIALEQPIFAIAKALFVVTMTFQIWNRALPRRLFAFLIALGFWIFGGYSFPEGIGLFMPDGFVSVIISGLQGVMVYSIAARNKPVELISAVITVTTGLVCYPVALVFSGGDEDYIFCCSIFFALVLSPFLQPFINLLKRRRLESPG